MSDGQGKLNPFQKAALAKQQENGLQGAAPDKVITDEAEEPHELEKPCKPAMTHATPAKSRNPFMAKQAELNSKKSTSSTETNSAAASPKARNPFSSASKAAEKVAGLPRPATTGPEVSESVSPAADGTSGSPSPVTADDYGHEMQPEGYTAEQVADFKSRLQQLKESFDNPDQISNALRAVGIQLSEHPAFANIMAPEDWGIMVRGLRESYGTVIQKKEGRRAAKSKNAEEEAAVQEILNGIDLSGALG